MNSFLIGFFLIFLQCILILLGIKTIRQKQLTIRPGRLLGIFSWRYEGKSALVMGWIMIFIGITSFVFLILDYIKGRPVNF